MRNCGIRGPLAAAAAVLGMLVSGCSVPTPTGTPPGSFDITRERVGQWIVGDAVLLRLSATGSGVSPTFAVADGAFPVGIALSASGTLSGTPTRPGFWSATVTVAGTQGSIDRHLWGWVAEYDTASAPIDLQANPLRSRFIASGNSFDEASMTSARWWGSFEPGQTRSTPTLLVPFDDASSPDVSPRLILPAEVLQPFLQTGHVAGSIEDGQGRCIGASLQDLTHGLASIPPPTLATIPVPVEVPAGTPSVCSVSFSDDGSTGLLAATVDPDGTPTTYLTFFRMSDGSVLRSTFRPGAASPPTLAPDGSAAFLMFRVPGSEELQDEFVFVGASPAGDATRPTGLTAQSSCTPPAAPYGGGWRNGRIAISCTVSDETGVTMRVGFLNASGGAPVFVANSTQFALFNPVLSSDGSQLLFYVFNFNNSFGIAAAEAAPDAVPVYLRDARGPEQGFQIDTLFG